MFEITDHKKLMDSQYAQRQCAILVIIELIFSEISIMLFVHGFMMCEELQLNAVQSLNHVAWSSDFKMISPSSFHLAE